MVRFYTSIPIEIKNKRKVRNIKINQTNMDEVLTKTFTFMKFPKPPKRVKKSMIDYARAKNKRTAVKKASKKKNRVHLPSISKLKEKANKLFGDFIKRRDKWTCVLCGKTKENAVITNGHLIKRGKKIHLFSELNCHALCSGCNKLDNYDHDIYVNWFIKVYGLKRYQTLFNSRNKLFQIKRGYLMYIINRYSVK